MGRLPNCSKHSYLALKEAIANLTDDGAVDPVVKATVVLSESGFAGIRDAIAFGEIKQDEGVVGGYIAYPSLINC